MSYLLGIDLGTSSVKVLLMDLEGHVQGMAQQHYDIQVPQAGWAEQSPEMWWEAVKKANRQLFYNTGIHPELVRGIGLSGQMHGLVLLDNKGEVIRPAVLWSDQRSKLQVDRLNDIMLQHHLTEQAMNSVSTGFALASLLWVKENEPHHYSRISRIVLPKDYIRFKLTGQIATEATDASSTLAFDTLNRTWAYPFIEAAGISTDWWPECREPYEIAGYVTSKAAAQTGLAADIPVVYGGADQCMQAVGNGIIEPGVVASNIGTGGQISTMISQPIYDARWRMNTFCHIFPGRWNIQGSSLNSGLSLKWLRDKVLGSADFEEMAGKASRVEAGSEGVVFLPYLNGERTPHMDPFARACFFGMTLKHHSGHLVRAVLEGVVYSLRESLELLEAQGIECDKVIASGGGAKSRVWLQIQADILGKRVHTTRTKEEACVGAAIMAGVGTEQYDSVESACKRIVALNEESYEPTAEHRGVYNHYYARFKELYSRNKEVFQQWDYVP